MYYVVYAVDFGVHRVVKSDWIQGNPFAKHVNGELNRNQIYRCFYTSGPNAAQTAYCAVDHTLALATGACFPDGDCCFRAKLKKFFGMCQIDSM